ncbi:hypothetical protein [Metabacillus litoralis]|uniref:hypothetical protein n=1 Tax=Metabacillus litoralis TaxID=152268 RepID=UPI001CFEF9C5|nr:hypothetical protein [Metabacillus litoralis]
MNVNPQSTRNIEIVSRKKISVKTVLTIYGIFTFLGLLLSIYTVPLSINGDMVFFRSEMEKEKQQEFLLFIFLSGFLYFILINIYPRRKVFFSTIAIVFSFSIFMVFYLLANPMAH